MADYAEIIKRQSDKQKRPSECCCLNFGCENPEFCDKFGWPCGDPTAPCGKAFAARMKEIGES